MMMTLRVLGAVLVLCVGCNSTLPTTATQNADPTAEVLPSPPILPLSTPIAMSTPVAASTTVPSATVSLPPTEEPTWTLVPTLPAPEVQATLLSLYAHDQVCNLPCWWGITPGDTTWATARSQLASLGDLFGPFGRGAVAWYDFALAVPTTLDPLGYFEPSIGVQNGIAVVISLNSRWVGSGFNYSLDGLLQTFGQPDEIWLKANADSPPEYGVPYDLDLYYKSKGILFSATGRGTKQGDRVAICPRPFQRGAFPPAIVLWSPAKSLSHAELLRWIERVTCLGFYDQSK